MIRFYRFSDFPSVSVVKMLADAYEPLFDSGVFSRKVMVQDWTDLDEMSHEEPDCFFITRYGYELAGFGSIDPRGRPVGRFGHHVVLPGFRGRGVGYAQIMEMEARLISQGCNSATAVTGAIDFFAPARKLYSKSGYILVSEDSGKPFNTYRYEKELEGF